MVPGGSQDESFEEKEAANEQVICVADNSHCSDRCFFVIEYDIPDEERKGVCREGERSGSDI